MTDTSLLEYSPAQGTLEAAPIVAGEKTTGAGMGEDRIALSALLREVLEGMWKEPDFVAYCRTTEDSDSSLESAA